MIPMLQIVQIRAATAQGAAGDASAASPTDGPPFSLLDTGFKPDQSDDDQDQGDTSPIAIQGAVPPVLGAPLPPLSETGTANSAPDSGLARAVTVKDGLDAGVTDADSQPRTDAEGTGHLAEQSVAPTTQSVGAPAPPALLASGAVEIALRVRWADHATKGTAKPDMAGSNQSPSNSLADVHLTIAPRPPSEPPVIAALFALTQDHEPQDYGIQPDPVGETTVFSTTSSASPVTQSNTLQSAPVGVAQLPARLVGYAVTGQDNQADLALNPEELGRLRFSIQHHGDKLTVVLSAERPETLILLRQNAPQLLAEFAAAGFAGTTLNFGKWGGGEHRSHSPAEPAESGTVPPETSPIASFKGPAQGLDLRL